MELTGHAPAQIANRIKAKGLQKLRWYCQMCGKQCRDENGFKCHLSSDSHQRQMMVFGQVSCCRHRNGSRNLATSDAARYPTMSVCLAITR